VSDHIVTELANSHERLTAVLRRNGAGDLSQQHDAGGPGDPGRAGNRAPLRAG
jgi:hypothetical protein